MCENYNQVSFSLQQMLSEHWEPWKTSKSKSSMNHGLQTRTVLNMWPTRTESVKKQKRIPPRGQSGLSCRFSDSKQRHTPGVQSTGNWGAWSRLPLKLNHNCPLLQLCTAESSRWSNTRVYWTQTRRRVTIETTSGNKEDFHPVFHSSIPEGISSIVFN